uniref:toxin VasX n=2 Tax=unclassified Aquisalimonas TaxID=2644645 RepID=UPI0025BA2B8A
TESDVGLMPVIPVRFADPEGERLAPLRDGWMYVFINGHLWREIQVSNEGEVFRDVNLARHQGRDDRPAACEALFHHVSLPYRMNAAEPVVEVAYADVQWSWATIERMGGFDPDDRRYCPDLDVYAPYNITVDDSLREARCQRIDLAAYDGDPDINRLRETFLVPTSTAESHFNPSDDPDQPPQLPGLTEDDITAGFAIMAVHDPLGVAMELIGTIQDETKALKACIEEIDQHEHVQSAVMAYQAFFNEALHEKSTQRDGGYRHADDSNEARELRSVAGDMDRDYIEALLQVDERRAVRERIREARNTLGQWLDGKCPNGGSADERVAQPVTVVQAIKDYAALSPQEYWRLWATVNGLTAGAGPDPAQIDSGYDADPDDPEDDPLAAWQARLTDPEHPLFPMLFPGEDQVPLDDDTPPATDDLNEVTGQTAFRPGAFALMLNGAGSGGVFGSVGRDVAWLGREVVMDFMYVVQRQWQAALDQQQTVSVELLTRIGKAGQFPELEGARLVREGDVIPEGYTVIGSQVERLHRMQRGARRQAARDAVRNPGADTVVILDGSTNSPIASSGLQGLAPATTSVAAATDSDWRALFSAKGGDGLYRARADLVLVPAVSETVRELSQPDAEPSLTTSRAVRAAQAGLPPVIAVFEVVNIASAANRLREGSDRVIREGAEMFLSTAGLAFALTEASLNLSGPDRTAARLSQVTGPRVANWVADGELRVRGRTSVPSMAVLGAGLAGIGAGLAAWDVMHRLNRGDTAAAAAHGVEAAAMTGLAVSTLVSGARQAGAAVVLGFGPWGWAFLATGIVAGAIARHLTRGSLERWAYYGPFGADHERRLTEEYAGLEPRQIRLALESLLFAPQVTIKEDERFGPPRVRVEVRAPAAARATDSVELYVTSEGGGGQQPLEVVATGELPDGPGPLCQAWWFRLPDPNEWYVTRDGRRRCTLRARARLRREGDGNLPFNPNYAGTQASAAMIDPDGETEDWAYADALTIRKTQRQIDQEF